jgi:plastocyanin
VIISGSIALLALRAGTGGAMGSAIAAQQPVSVGMVTGSHEFHCAPHRDRGMIGKVIVTLAGS